MNAGSFFQKTAREIQLFCNCFHNFDLRLKPIARHSKIKSSEVHTGKAIRLEDASGRYSEYLKSTLDKNIKIKKLKIVLDCGNGATYEIAPNIFWELGHEVITINNTPNGKNINKNCLFTINVLHL